MPYLSVTDGYGYTWQCASSDPEVLGRWLVETITRVHPPGQYAEAMPLRVHAHPMTDREGKEDWPRESWRMIGGQTPVDYVRKVIAWLQAEVDRGQNL